MRKSVRQILNCAAALLVACCAVVVTAQEKTSAANESAKTPEASAVNAALARQTGDNARKYRIGVGDELIIQVLKQPNYSSPAPLRVNESGYIFLPKIDQPIKAVCKTENELSDELTGYYKKYIRQPFVSVYVKDYKSQPVAVMGAVDKAGTFYINRQMRLIQAISLAGGPTNEAGSRVLLARLGDVDLCTMQNTLASSEAQENQTMSGKVYTYNLRRMMEGEEASNPLVQPGDIISILEADKAYVIGNVKGDKTTIVLKEPRTLSQAIAEAGGVDIATKKREIFILRQDEKGNKTRTPYNLIAINEGKEKDPYLLPNDIVEVPTDNKKSTLDNLKKAFINGLPAVLPWLL